MLLRCHAHMLPGSLRPYSSASAHDISRIRNIGIIAHIDAGKTTTTERMLFYSGHTRRLGNIDRGDTVMDYLAQERSRGITISSAAITFPWLKHRINLIDTPGHVDFGVEVERAIRVLDGAVAVLDAAAGVEAQTETVWRQAEKHQVPRLAFVNKMDKIGADFEKTVAELRTRLQGMPLLLQLPIMHDGQLAGIVDLVNWRMIRWADPTGSVLEYSMLPQTQTKNLPGLSARNKLLEDLCEHDDMLLDKYLESPELIQSAHLKAAIRRATIGGKIAPVLCGASARNIGVQPLLDAVVDYLPSPLDRPAPRTIGSSKFSAQQLVALAFKVAEDPQRGLLVFVRVYSGTLYAKAVLRNSRGAKERATKACQVYANELEEVESISAGNIGILMGLKWTSTGDTLLLDSDTSGLQLEGINVPPPVYMCAVEPASVSESCHLEKCLKTVALEDPSLSLSKDENGQMLLAGMGELHLEIVRHRVVDELKAKAVFGPMRIAYRETISKEGTKSIKLEKDTLNGKWIAELGIHVAPIEGDSEEYVANEISVDRKLFHAVLDECGQKLPAGVSDAEVMMAIASGLESALQCGVVAGYPMSRVSTTLSSLIWHEGSTLQAIRYCAYQLLGELLHASHPVLLEPFMAVEIRTPTEYIGPILRDIHSTLRGNISEIIDASGGTSSIQVIKAEAPLKELAGYASRLRSMTSGNAAFSMAIKGYREMSAHDQRIVCSA